MPFPVVGMLRKRSQVPREVRLRLPCELVTEHLLSIVRKLLAQELVRENGVSQVQAARILGVTQPAVSNYIHSNPSRGEHVLGEAIEDVQATVKAFSEDLLEGRLDQIEAMRRICGLCIGLRTRGPLCTIHAEDVPYIRRGSCSLCITDLTDIRRMTQEDYGLIENVRYAILTIEGSGELAAMTPEIGMNIAYAKPEATDIGEVVGVPGKIRPIGDRLRASRPPDFGGSSHVARAALTMMRFDPSLRSAISLKYDREVIEVCEGLNLAVSNFDRSEEPIEVKEVDGRTIPWGVERAVEKIGKPPDVIYDLGEVGKEPMIFLFGRNAQEVAQLAATIVREHARKSIS
jgi:predicted fused transcriptional regulator/phosphomethylpyrimidine kinase/predicted transcriptional regulator